MLDKLRKQADYLVEATINTPSHEKYLLIQTILKNDNCFLEMDSIDAISILIDLKVNSEDIKKVYITLMEKERDER